MDEDASPSVKRCIDSEIAGDILAFKEIKWQFRKTLIYTYIAYNIYTSLANTYIAYNINTSLANTYIAYNIDIERIPDDNNKADPDPNIVMISFNKKISKGILEFNPALI
jgi:hypothetical protein